MNLLRDMAGASSIVRVEDDTIFVDADSENCDDLWYYWYFGIQPNNMKRVLLDLSRIGVVGSFGPAIRIGDGEWNWYSLVETHETQFPILLPENGEKIEVASVIPYTAKNYTSFRDRHQRHRSEWSSSILGKSEDDNNVFFESLSSKNTLNNAIKILVTCRHHASETSASFVLEGIILEALSKLTEADVSVDWIPIVDVDGVEAGHQGKGRLPHDHNRDYVDEPMYAPTRAIQSKLRSSPKEYDYVIDLHAPWIREAHNEVIHFVEPQCETALKRIRRLSHNFGNQLRQSNIPYTVNDNMSYGKRWNSNFNNRNGSFTGFARSAFPDATVGTLEVPHAKIHDLRVNPEILQSVGAALFRSILNDANGRK